jgi:hypothetical protein
VKFSNLRALTGEERENMTLVGYGGFALTDQPRQYYVPSADGSTWVENTERQPRGIAYVALVRQNINRH